MTAWRFDMDSIRRAVMLLECPTNFSLSHGFAKVQSIERIRQAKTDAQQPQFRRAYSTS